MRVGSDTGGTFTDVVAADGTATKVLSTPGDPGIAVRAGLAALAGHADGAPEVLAHGTTVATNALLEGAGARVALVCTDGFADVIEIARQDRPSLYDQWADRPSPLVARADRLEVTERLGPDGAVVTPLDLASLPDMATGVEAVAVCLLHSDLNPDHERAVAAHLEGLGWDVSASVDVSPEFREYERTATTVVNASLRLRCRAYLRGLEGVADEVLVMTSAGALLPVGEVADLPASLVLSGPAGGVAAAAAVAAMCGYPDALTFDMGGTSTDVSLVLGGRPSVAAQRSVGGYPVRLPSVDVHTVGAGGGSIARVDAGGALVVGPKSAGASPGPACYGLGGTDATVTDANLVAGRIPPGAPFGDLGALSLDAAVAALERAGVSAQDVIDVVDVNMAQALRHVSVERGVDPAGLALVAFGGAGPLHACSLADDLGVPVVIIPPRAGVLSAVGLLTSPVGRTLVRSWPTPDDHTGLAAAGNALGAAAAGLIVRLGLTSGAKPPAADVEVEVAFDCRYRGQSHELTVPSVEAFHAEHELRNGYARPGTPVEVVAIRATASLPARFTVADLPPVPRGPVRGPAVVVEADCTVWVPEGWSGSPGPGGALVLERST